MIPFGISLTRPSDQSSLDQLLGIDRTKIYETQLESTYSQCCRFIDHNPEKHQRRASQFAFLVREGGVFDSSSKFRFSEKLDFIKLEPQAIEQFVKLPPKKQQKKQKQQQNDGELTQKRPITSEIKAPKTIEDVQSVEEVFEEDLPKYLRSVEPPTQAKRDIWNYMFEQAIERSLNWFEAIDKLP